MKKILAALLFTSFAAQAQVDTYDYLYFCDKMMVNANNSVQCLQHLYADLVEFKKKSSHPFKNFNSYNCIDQPDDKEYAKIKAGPSNVYKTAASEMWKLSNDCYAKSAEIIAYIRLEDYKTNLDKGFALVREMQQMQIAMGKARDRVAEKVVAEAKASTAANSYIKPYQVLMTAMVHEDEFIRKLSQNFNDWNFVGYPREEILKSFLETDEIIKSIKNSRFSVPEPAYLKACIEGLELIQKTKQNSLDNFNNTSTFDGAYLNTLYDNLINYFNNDILHFYSNYCAQARVNYYPRVFREYDFDAPAQTWALTNMDYTLPTIDSLTITKQAGALPKAGFEQLNDIVYYLDECVRSMENIYKELRSEASTWNDLREKDMPYRNPIMKFDKAFVPVTLHGLIVKGSKNLPAPYRTGLMDRVNDVEHIMLALQENLMDLSGYMSRGDFRTGTIEYIDTKLKRIETLYTELDERKEKLFLQIRDVYAAYTPAKKNAWTTSAGALLKAADHSRQILHQMDRRVYHGDESPISTAAIHEDQRDLIINQISYMKGIMRIGGNSGLDPYTPYDYIPGYLKTLEEKVTDLDPKIDNKNKTYGDFLYMHNIIAYQFNKFAELGLGGNEYSVNDPMRPVYILWYIRQPPKFHHEIPPPKAPEAAKEPEAATPEEVLVADIPIEPISFEGYPFNNLVLLLDVSASMNKPDRLPLLKWSFEKMVRMMRKEDEVSIVIYSGKATVALPPKSASDTMAIIKAIQNLKSDGTTNIADGIALAYKTANKNFIDDGNNKIIIATDGEFKLTETIYKLVEKNNSKIVLSVFDFSQLPDPLKAIQQLAERGKGNYVKVTTDNALEVLAVEARKEKNPATPGQN